MDKIKVLYNDTESVIKVNGGLSAPFRLVLNLSDWFFKC